jgi:hypothetical protein
MGMSETTTVGDEWLSLPDAVGATGMTERTLQWKAAQGEIERDDRGFGQVLYRTTPAMRRDRREEAQIVAILRDQGSKQTATIEVVAAFLLATTVGASAIAWGLYTAGDTRARQIESENEQLRNALEETRVRLEQAEKATMTKTAERDALAEILVSFGAVSGDECEDGDKSATASPF